MLITVLVIISAKSFGQTPREVVVKINQTLCSVTGIPTTETYAVHPNPVNTILTIEAMDETTRIFLIDVSGRSIPLTQLKINKTQVDVRSVSDGLYVLWVQRQTGVQRTKIMISHK